MPRKHRKLFVLALALSLASLACNYVMAFFPTATSVPDPFATLVAGTLQGQGTIPTPGGTEEPKGLPGLFPHSLYYLNNGGEDGYQVWRLERDSITQTQITHEPEGVTAFDVSPLDGTVAYVSNNQLLMVDALGKDKRLLMDGGEIAESGEGLYRTRIGDPVWSPNGRYLAFSLDGVQIFDTSSNQLRHLITNEVDRPDEDSYLPVALYAPEAFSSLSDFLLISIGFYEGSTLAVLSPEGDLIEFEGGVTCCHPTWEPEGYNVIVASPFLGVLESGLWRYNARNGAVETLIPSTSEDSTLNFVGWPIQLKSGELRYFYTNMASFPEGEVPLSIVRSDADGASNRTILRPDAISLVEALWAPDGSLVLVVEPAPGEPSWPPRGPVILVLFDDSPLRPILTNAYNLRWGP